MPRSDRLERAFQPVDESQRCRGGDEGCSAPLRGPNAQRAEVREPEEHRRVQAAGDQGPREAREEHAPPEQLFGRRVDRGHRHGDRDLGGVRIAEGAQACCGQGARPGSRQRRQADREPPGPAAARCSERLSQSTWPDSPQREKPAPGQPGPHEAVARPLAKRRRSTPKTRGEVRTSATGAIMISHARRARPAGLAPRCSGLHVLGPHRHPLHLPHGYARGPSVVFSQLPCDINDPEHWVVPGGLLDLLRGWIGVHAEVGARLLRGRPGPAPFHPPAQVRGDDLGPFLGGYLYQVDRVRFAAADHRAPIGCPDVANPLPLAGQ